MTGNSQEIAYKKRKIQKADRRSKERPLKRNHSVYERRPPGAEGEMSREQLTAGSRRRSSGLAGDGKVAIGDQRELRYTIREGGEN